MSVMTRFIAPATQRHGAIPGRSAVPWATVLPLAVVMAYADGFWMTSLRGAAGAIERTQGPFASWLRESTLILPLFVFAVLGAVTLALHLFGPVLGSSRRLLATLLLVVAAGTLVGIAALAASSAYDYHLQSDQLQLMDSMRTTNAANLLTLQQNATLWLQVRAVAYGSGILLVTNLVAVGWVVALKGGRLHVSTPQRTPVLPTAMPPTALTGEALSAHMSRADDLRLLLAAGLLGTAAIHAAVVPEHLTEWAAAGVFFVVLVAAELGVAALLLARPQPRVLLAAAAVSIGPLALWCYSRTVGMSFGPGAGAPEQVGLSDIAACVLEISTLLVAVLLLRRSEGLRRRPPASVHLRWLALVAVIAVTAIGLAGSGVAWLDGVGGSSDQPVMLSPH